MSPSKTVVPGAEPTINDDTLSSLVAAVAEDSTAACHGCEDPDRSVPVRREQLHDGRLDRLTRSSYPLRL